ncbi:MAG: TM0106 family RecB-like putative nuclease, partial [bacterium]
MYRFGSELILSATDLASFLGCRHRTALEMAVAAGERARPHVDDPLLEILWERGAEHERQYVARLREGNRNVVDVSGVGLSAERVASTLDAMRGGADVIVQGELRDGRWAGRPDIMQRVEKPSAIGAWSYEVADTKLARETRAGTILQLGLYSEMLAAAQGAPPEHFFVVTPDETTAYRVDDYAAYFRLIRGQMLATVEQDYDVVAATNYPEPVDLCEVCPWLPECAKKRRADDHLSLVAGITRTQRRELESRSIDTLTTLAGIPLPLAFKPRRGSADTYQRVREQARLQLVSRGTTPPLHELLDVEAEKGLCRLPEPSAGDLFLDLEGDPFAAEGGREYLFGVAKGDGSYEAAWAFTEQEERRGFEWVMDMIAESARLYPEMHVYHYAPYEPAAFKRLMGRYATRERELDAMLRSGRFVDLYAVVRQGLRAGIERYSIKNLEPLYEFKRAVELIDARKSLKVMELGLETGMPSAVPLAIRDTVEGYNRDDCVSTLRLRDWLERVRTEEIAKGADIPRRVLDEGAASDKVDERAQRVDALRARLLAGVPELRTDRDAEQQSRWLLAYMLDYHRREDKASWWEYYR